MGLPWTARLRHDSRRSAALPPRPGSRHPERQGIRHHRIKPNRFYPTDEAGLDVTYVARKEPLEIALGVSVETTGEEFDYLLHPGDTFPVGDQTWEVTGVDQIASSPAM